jgi:hypothetical protein
MHAHHIRWHLYLSVAQTVTGIGQRFQEIEVFKTDTMEAVDDGLLGAPPNKSLEATAKRLFLDCRLLSGAIDL